MLLPALLLPIWLPAPKTDLNVTDSTVTNTVISAALLGCRKVSASGADNISYPMVEHVHRTRPDLLAS